MLLLNVCFLLHHYLKSSKDYYKLSRNKDRLLAAIVSNQLLN
nr:MAG TPA: hypothetical protein [Crassvirales sp.]